MSDSEPLHFLLTSTGQQQQREVNFSGGLPLALGCWCGPRGKELFQNIPRTGSYSAQFLGHYSFAYFDASVFLIGFFFFNIVLLNESAIEAAVFSIFLILSVTYA